VRTYYETTLTADFPNLYSRMWGNFTCGDGWECIIRNLSNQLDFLNEYAPLWVEAVQVKEKFGTLRYYVNISTDNKWWTDIVYALIDAAEARSALTCEECGSYGGKLRTGGWIRTLCDECEEKRGSSS
jgi:hypothetical protein